jgi:DNA-binding NarL/FixJ family response regulator
MDGEVKPMCNPSSPVHTPELIVIDLKRLRQAGMKRLLETWAETMGLKLKVVAQLTPFDSSPVACQMTIINVGGASVQDAPYHELIPSVRKLIAEAPLVIISDREEPQEISAAFEQGAVGFIPTSVEPAVLFHALSFIMKGGSFFPPSALSTCFYRRIGSGLASTSDLTAKQRDVFNRLCQGHSNKAIARQLDLSEGTVKVHVRRIIQKFGVANRTQLAISAVTERPLPGPVTATLSIGLRKDVSNLVKLAAKE